MQTEHTFISGITGSGKTEFAGRMFNETEGVNIFINTNAEMKIEDLGENVDKMPDVIKLLEKGKKKIVFTPDKITVEDYEELQAVLFALGKVMAGRDRRIWCHLFVDEIQELAPKVGGVAEHVFKRFATRGKRYGIILVSMSQRPGLVSHTVLTQSYYHVIFELGDYEIPYFRDYRIPIEEHKSWIAQPYHYIIKSPTEIAQKPPIEPIS